MDSQHRILIVDDTPANIKLLRELLRHTYEISVATNGRNALHIIQNPDTRPDLVLLDIMMPDMDGYEVCRRLKADPATCSVPIIFITAKSEVEDETQGLELGAVDYVTKPFHPAIVLARIKTHLMLLDQERTLARQNRELAELLQLREDVERMARHDLKAPLNGIIGLPELMLTDENLTQDQQESLQLVIDGGYQMLNMINLSLDLFKMERGLYQTNPAAVDLIPIFHKIRDEQDAALKSLEIGMEVLINDRPAEATASFKVLGERMLCYSLFSNLIKNAVEASHRGTLIKIGLYSETDFQKIRIQNAGEVPEPIRDRFFDKYVTAGKRQGSGLGTYTARLMTQVQGGEIQMASSAQTGTCITVRLPAIAE